MEENNENNVTKYASAYRLDDNTVYNFVDADSQVKITELNEKLNECLVELEYMRQELDELKERLINLQNNN